MQAGHNGRQRDQFWLQSSPGPFLDSASDESMNASNSPPCSANNNCEDRSSDKVCDVRCVSANANGCITFEKCYNMYSGYEYEDVDCDRFPSCNCESIKVFPTYAPTKIEDKRPMCCVCGACINGYGCHSEDKCWDMCRDWELCMAPPDTTGSSFYGCSTGPRSRSAMVVA